MKMFSGKPNGARNSKRVQPKHRPPYWIYRTFVGDVHSRRPDKHDAAKHRIPKSLRQYAVRYGSSVDEIIRTDRDHG